MRNKPTPEQIETARNALRAVRAKFKTQLDMAEKLGVTQGTISLWINKGKLLPAECVLAAEAATGVSRHLLRPDLYPDAWHGVDRGTGRVDFNRNSTLQGQAA